MTIMTSGITSNLAMIGVDETTVGGNDRSAVPADATAISVGPTDLKGGGAMTLSGASGKVTYLTGIILDYLGATAAGTWIATISGSNLLVGGARVVVIPIPIGATLVPEKMVLHYDPPLQTAATNSTITVTVPAGPSGLGVSSFTVNGYRL